MRQVGDQGADGAGGALRQQQHKVRSAVADAVKKGEKGLNLQNLTKLTKPSSKQVVERVAAEEA